MEIELKYTIGEEFLIERIFADDQIVSIKDENTEEEIPMEAVFYDTADQKIRNKGYAYRIRREGDDYVATLKWGGAATDGMHKRQELNISLGADPEMIQPNLSLFSQDEEAGCMIEEIGDEPLVPLMEIKYLRKQVRLDTGKSISMLSADVGYVRAGGKEAPICEMEIELYSGDETDMSELGDRIAAKYNLKPENTSKFKRGLNLLK
ncbi:MAG: CYTH domain-containing protein [Eubacteriaceae bacterium]|nr:CYTH domain-containing protein [Eubacteriaceae bacterium]